MNFDDENLIGDGSEAIPQGSIIKLKGLRFRFGSQYIEKDEYVRSIGGEFPAYAQAMLDLSNRTKRGQAGPNEAAALFAKNAATFEKNLLLEAQESTRLNTTANLKSFIEGPYSRHGYEIETVDAAIVTTAGGIPLNQKVYDQHKLYQEGKGRHPLGKAGEYAINSQNEGYYHLEINADGHAVVYMNDLFAGSMIMDMDGDRARLILARKRNSKGEIVDEFMIPYKEPLTQNTPLFRNIQYQRAIQFDPNSVFGRYSGLNFTDLGNQLETASSIKNAFTREVATRKYSLLGEFERGLATDRAGFGGVRDLEALQEKIAEKQLKDSMVGMKTNLLDVKAIYENVQAAHALKMHDPKMYRTLLLEQQEAAKAYLAEAMDREDGSTRVVGSQLYGGLNADGSKFEGQYKDYLLELLKHPDAPEKNKALEAQLQTHMITSRFLDDPKRIAEIEGALKLSRTTNNQEKVQESVMDSMKWHLTNQEYFTKNNSITNLREDLHSEMVAKYYLEAENMAEAFDRTFLYDIKTHHFQLRESSATQIINKYRKPKPITDIRPNKGSTTLDRLVHTSLDDKGTRLIRLTTSNSTDGRVWADHLLEHENYREDPLAVVFYDGDGNILGPRVGRGPEGTFTGQVGLVGNIARVVNGDLDLVDRTQYLKEELERRLRADFGDRRGFGEGSEEFGFQKLVNTLTGSRSTLRDDILAAYGLHGQDEEKASLGRALAGRLQKAGENSELHRQIVLKYDIAHRGWMQHRIKTHFEDIINQVGGTSDAAALINQYGDVVHLNPTDVRKVTTTYGIDSRMDNAEEGHLKQLMALGMRKYGGHLRKNTSQGKDRFLHMTFGNEPGNITPLGLAANLYMPADLARRSSDIQRQLTHGTFLGNTRVALFDTDISQELFDMYDPNAPMGTKRHDEGLILMSRDFRDRAVEKVKQKVQFGAVIKEEELGQTMEEYIHYQLGDRTLISGRRLTRGEEQVLRKQLQAEFASLYQKETIHGKTQYRLNEKGFDTYISRVMKLGSLLGDKAMVRVVDDIRDHSGGSIDVAIHVNQAASRSNTIARLQQAAQTAIKEGRLQVSDFGEGLVQNGEINFRAFVEKYGNDPSVFREKIKEGFLDPLKKATHTVSFTHGGKTQTADNILTLMSDDIFATGGYSDVYRIFGESGINNRSVSKTKLLGRIMNNLESEFGLGGIIANIGSQFLMHSMGEFAAKTVQAHVYGEASAESIRAAEILAANKASVHLGRTGGQALHDAVMDEAGIRRLGT
jgi:hypothetical protein